MINVPLRIGTALEQCSCSLNRFFFLISAFCLVIMSIPTFLDVVARYFFNYSIAGAIDIAELLLAMIIFGALGYVNDRQGHISVTLFTEHFSDKTRTALQFFTAGVSVALFSVMVWCMFRNGMEKMAGGEVSFAISLPIYIFVFICTLFLCGFVLSLCAQFFLLLGRLLADGNRIGLLAGTLLIAVAVASPWLLRDTPVGNTPLYLGMAGMSALMLLLFLGLPIGTGMAGIGFTGMLLFYPNALPALSMLGVTPFATAASYIYAVVPLFIFMGELAMYSGISRDLFNAANCWLGHRPGGLAVATVAGCAGFSAVSGDSMATAVTMSSVALPEMSRKKYDQPFACATLAAGGTLGILIPPSTGFIFYSLVTEVSIGKLFVAGLIPGLLLAALFIGSVTLFAVRHPQRAPRGAAADRGEKLRSLWSIIPMLALIAIILGGILGGLFSPNAGGAVGVVCITVFAGLRGRLTWSDFKKAAISTTEVTAKLLFILIGVMLLGYFFAATRLPFELADMLVGMDANRWVIFIGIVVFYIVLGCLLNVIPMILLTLPAIFPSIEALHFDPVWFGVVCVVLMEMGQITPPVGINVFALSTMAPDVPMLQIFRRIVPFFLSMLLLVLLLALFPQLALWLPGLL